MKTRQLRVEIPPLTPPSPVAKFEVETTGNRVAFSDKEKPRVPFLIQAITEDLFLCMERRSSPLSSLCKKCSLLPPKRPNKEQALSFTTTCCQFIENQLKTTPSTGPLSQFTDLSPIDILSNPDLFEHFLCSTLLDRPFDPRSFRIEQFCDVFGIHFPKKKTREEYLLFETSCMHALDTIQQHLPKTPLFSVFTSLSPYQIQRTVSLLRQLLTAVYEYTLLRIFRPDCTCTYIEEQTLTVSQLRETPPCAIRTTLTCSNQDLFCLPQEVCDLPGIEHLDISNNPITTIPPYIVNMKSLSHLDIGGTLIRDLPVALAGLPSLQTISAIGTPLKEIPDELTGITIIQA